MKILDENPQVNITRMNTEYFIDLLLIFYSFYKIPANVIVAGTHIFAEETYNKIILYCNWSIIWTVKLGITTCKIFKTFLLQVLCQES